MLYSFSFLLLATLFTSSIAFVIQPGVEAIEANVTSNLDVTYYYAVDATQLLTSYICSCLGKAGYGTVFIRGYTSDGEGTVDKNAVTTFTNCRGYLASEIYMLPNPRSSKTGGDQLTEMYQSLTSNGIIMRRVWIQVTMLNNWSINSTLNVDFLKYYNESGDGFTGESPADFSDFQSFAGFSSPRVKQFARNEQICGATVNRSVYQQYF